MAMNFEKYTLVKKQQEWIKVSCSTVMTLLFKFVVILNRMTWFSCKQMSQKTARTEEQELF